MEVSIICTLLSWVLVTASIKLKSLVESSLTLVMKSPALIPAR